MKLFFKLFLSGIMVLLVAEGILRGKEMNLPSEKRWQKKILSQFYFKVVQELYNPKKVKFFQAPFESFENFKLDDKAFIQKVYHDTMGPVGTSVITENNLVQTGEKFRYSLNKLGFRGPDRDLKKKPGSKRILALGSYQTWGIGVHDEDTYAALLEKEFGLHNPELKVEVWNAGRNSSKAVTGLAQLTHGVLAMKPDLVLIDFGFCDSLRIFADPRLLLSNKSLNLKKLGTYSFLIRELDGFFNVKPQFDDPLPGFRTVMNKMITLLQEKGIPVLLVEQPMFFTDQTKPYFREAEARGIPVFKVQDAFNSYPPKSEDWGKTDWIKNIPTELHQKIPILKDAPYKTTPFHLNAQGNEILARDLRKLIIREDLLTKSRTKAP